MKRERQNLKYRSLSPIEEGRPMTEVQTQPPATNH